MVDMAHIAGLVAAGRAPEPGAARRLRHHHHAQDPARPARRPDPLPRAEYAKAIDRAVFPGIQGGPLMHVIAAKAVCFREAARAGVQATTSSRSSRTPARWRRPSRRQGFRLVSGGTDNHLMLVDVCPKGITGKDAESGARQGGHHGQQEHDPVRPEPADDHERHPHRHAGRHHARHERAGDGHASASFIARVLASPDDDQVHRMVRAEVEALCRTFPLYPDLLSTR